jgi:hypothetical protein
LSPPAFRWSSSKASSMAFTSIEAPAPRPRRGGTRTTKLRTRAIPSTPIGVIPVGPTRRAEATGRPLWVASRFPRPLSPSAKVVLFIRRWELSAGRCRRWTAAEPAW